MAALIGIKELVGPRANSCLEIFLGLENGNLTGTELVIDKDRASALLAVEIGAQAGLTLINVSQPKVSLRRLDNNLAPRADGPGSDTDNSVFGNDSLPGRVHPNSTTVDSRILNSWLLNT